MNPSPNDACVVCGRPSRLVARLAGGRSVWRCSGCGLRSLRPRPAESEARSVYERPGYFEDDLGDLHRGLRRGYEEDTPVVRLYRRHLLAIMDLMPPPADLLEIGCARGVFLDLARRAGYRVAGVELNLPAAEYARREFGLDVAADLAAAKGSAGELDIVAAFDVLEHVTDPVGFIRAAASRLRGGGIMVIGTPDTRSLLYRLAETAARATFGRWTYPLYRFFGRGSEHLQLFNEENIRSLFRAAGLSVRRQYAYGIPLANMSAVSGGYRFGLKLFGAGKYERVYLAEKLT